MASPDRALILVIGATGAQGTAVVKALLSDKPDVLGSSDPGTPRQFRVRVFTRNKDGRRAQELASLGDIEFFEGDIKDLNAVREAMKGCYGVFVNIDGFTVGEDVELFLGMRMFEIAKEVKTVRHYVWSSLDYNTKKGNYDPQYRCEHYDAKGRVAEFLKAQKSNPQDGGMIWSVLTSGPYMEMLLNFMFCPINKREDGTFVFAAPLPPPSPAGQPHKGHVPMIALSDLGYYAKYLFSHPTQFSGVDLEIATQMVDWFTLVETFTKVTGKPAVFIPQTLDEWFAHRPNSDRPVAVDFARHPDNARATTFRKNFSGWWSAFRDDILTRDMDMLKTIHPNKLDLESWMRAENYDGETLNFNLLKIAEDTGGGKRLSDGRSVL